jgi:hypothetical protein
MNQLEIIYKDSGTTAPALTLADYQTTAPYQFSFGTARSPSISLSGLIGSGFQLGNGAHTTGSVPLRFTNMGGYSNSSGTVSAGAGGSWTVYGNDFPVDITQTSILKTVAGQCALTRAVAGTIPAGVQAVCDGTNWRAVHNTTLLF